MPGLREVFQTLYKRDAVLTIVGVVNLAAAVVLLLLLPFESRQLLGLNLWVKPIKFFLSATVYLWTLAILLPYLKTAYPRSVRVITWSTAVVMLVENGCIALQAARGVTSHFNNSTLFDGVLFGVMGLFIAWNTIVILWAIALFFRVTLALPRAYLWGIRLGFVLFLAGSSMGGVMVRLQSHTIGASMDGAGLPFVNWSLLGGDLRIAHFLGLHALQILPLAGYLFSRYWSTNTRRPVLAIILFAFLYGLTVFGLYRQAMNGHAVIAVFGQ